MKDIKYSIIFENWLKDLRDTKGRSIIVQRLTRFRFGNYGDHKWISEKVIEARIFYGPGYRLYFMEKGQEIILLLVGGDKSTQEKDIKKALTMAKEE